MVGIVGREILRINARGGASDALLIVWSREVWYLQMSVRRHDVVRCLRTSISDVLEPGLEGATLNDGDLPPKRKRPAQTDRVAHENRALLAKVRAYQLDSSAHPNLIRERDTFC